MVYYGKEVTMADRFQQTDMYHSTNQQLQEAQERMNGGNGNREGRRRTGAYARNIFWQVWSYLSINIVTMSCVCFSLCRV